MTSLERFAVGMAPLVILGASLGSCGDEDGKPPNGDAGETSGGEGGRDGDGGSTGERGGTAGAGRGGASAEGGAGASDPGGAGIAGEPSGGSAGSAGSGGNAGAAGRAMGGSGPRGGSGGTSAEGGDGGSGGETCTTVELPLGNAGFDTNATAWTLHDDETGPSRPIIVTVGITAQSPPNVAHLGGVNAAAAGMFQPITLPDGAVSVTLTGYRRIATLESGSTPLDVLNIQLWEDARTATGLIGDFAVLGNGDASNDWVDFTGTVDVDTHAGETLELDLWAETDSSLITEFYVDSLGLTAEVCR
jgi:hypothetical protein